MMEQMLSDCVQEKSRYCILLDKERLHVCHASIYKLYPKAFLKSVKKQVAVQFRLNQSQL